MERETNDRKRGRNETKKSKHAHTRTHTFDDDGMCRQVDPPRQRCRRHQHLNMSRRKPANVVAKGSVCGGKKGFE